MKHESYVSLDAVKMLKEADLYKNENKMEISLIKNVVTVTKRTDKFNLDFRKLVEYIIKDWDISFNGLSEENKEDIVANFECDFETYLGDFLGIDLYDMEYENEEGYDIGDNAKIIEKIKNEFAEYVYNL
jgi:hypothetical protein